MATYFCTVCDTPSDEGNWKGACGAPRVTKKACMGCRKVTVHAKTRQDAAEYKQDLKKPIERIAR